MKQSWFVYILHFVMMSALVAFMLIPAILMDTSVQATSYTPHIYGVSLDVIASRSMYLVTGALSCWLYMKSLGSTLSTLGLGKHGLATIRST
jgi:hypothetical protein